MRKKSSFSQFVKNVSDIYTIIIQLKQLGKIAHNGYRYNWQYASKGYSEKIHNKLEIILCESRSDVERALYDIFPVVAIIADDLDIVIAIFINRWYKILFLKTTRNIVKLVNIKHTILSLYMTTRIWYCKYALKKGKN